MKIFDRILYRFKSVKKNRFLFSSYSGHYSDSPKLLSEKIHILNPKIEIAWRIDPSYCSMLPDYVVPVIKGSKKDVEYLSTAEVCIDNFLGFNNVCVLRSDSLIDRLRFIFVKALKNKKSQHVYTTWHGAPVKKIGRDEPNSNIYKEEILNTTFFLGDMHTENVMRRMFSNDIDIKLFGSPRNDVLCSNCNCSGEIKEKLGLPKEKKIVLFAPTFRGEGNAPDLKRSGLNQLSIIDFKEFFQNLEEKFGGDWIFICRFHQFVSKEVNWEILSENYGDRLINGNSSDEMADYLCCADILITDISSCMFDFAHTKKPCFLFFPDIEEYLEKERGMYYDIDELPFQCSRTSDELIEHISSFNEAEYIKKLNDFMKRFGAVSNNESTTIIAEYILRESDNGGNIK